TQHTGASPFCNAVRPAFVFPSPQPTTLLGADATWDPTSTETAQNGLETAVYRSVYQDNDPIRRNCAGSATSTAPAEDVCSHSGDLGLVLPIPEVEELSPRSDADRYNASPCVVGRITSAAPPDVYDAITQKKIICGRDGHGLVCPNGDTCTPFGGCYVPADALGNGQCLATQRMTPGFSVSTLAVPRAHALPPTLNDGRSFNAHLYVAVGNAAAYQVQSAARPYRVTGAYHRIHAVHSLAVAGDAGAPPPTCQNADLGAQIACLVTASPCSIAYAGLAALSSNTAAGPIKIDKQSPRVNCIQGNLSYPLSRKLYANALGGFGALTGAELQLAGCLTDLAQPGLTPPTPAGLVTAEIAAAGFIPLPAFANGGGEPYCEDFDEATLCGAAANRVACATPPAALNNFPAPAQSTVCGDGLIDPYEDCDLGSGNGPPPATCSSTCRFNQ
ncbi:MAG: hypothetical protein JOZ69_18150, partial [Myxococcales bacterium]|nr:hypothetical protein [Myxococcales bacterium]